MTFLATVEERGRALMRRVSEIRSVVAGPEAPAPSDPGVTNGIRVPFDIRDRLTEVQSRHGFSSTRETIYKCMVLGLITLERLEPEARLAVPRRRRPQPTYRALSEEEISQLRDGGTYALQAASGAE